MSVDRMLEDTRRWWFGTSVPPSKDQLVTDAMKRASADHVEREAKAKSDAAWNALSPAEQAAHIEASLLIARAAAR